MGVSVVDGFDGVDVVKGIGVFGMRVVELLDIFLIVFGLFLAYQIILYLLGGSWAVDTLTLGFQFVIIGILWRMKIDIIKNGMKIDGHIRWHARSGK